MLARSGYDVVGMFLGFKQVCVVMPDMLSQAGDFYNMLLKQSSEIPFFKSAPSFDSVLMQFLRVRDISNSSQHMCAPRDVVKMLIESFPQRSVHALYQRQLHLSRPLLILECW